MEQLIYSNHYEVQTARNRERWNAKVWLYRPANDYQPLLPQHQLETGASAKLHSTPPDFCSSPYFVPTTRFASISSPQLVPRRNCRSRALHYIVCRPETGAPLYHARHSCLSVHRGDGGRFRMDRERYRHDTLHGNRTDGQTI